jgi:hypothetical protein
MTYLGRMHHIVGVAVARAGTLMQGSRWFPPSALSGERSRSHLSHWIHCSA